MKKSLSLLFILLCSTFVFAKSYKISSVYYDITPAGFKFLGKTSVFALESNVSVDKNKIFNSEKELLEYLLDYEQQLANLRAFETIKITSNSFGSLRDFETKLSSQNQNDLPAVEAIIQTYESAIEAENNNNSSESTGDDSSNILEENIYNPNVPEAISDYSDNITEKKSDNNDYEEISIKVILEDSHHMLVVPYVFKVDSNYGWNPKIKAKDSNFMGSLNTMDAYFEGVFPFGSASADTSIGLGINFDLPFKAGIFNSTFVNDYTFDYNFTQNTPEFSAQTGLKLVLPTNLIDYTFELYQYGYRDADYIPYGDDLYFKEYAQLSFPIKLAEVKNWGKITYKPFVNYTFTWDKDGFTYPGFEYSVVNFGHTFSTSRINWNEQFRKGASFNVSNTYAINTQSSVFNVSFSLEAKAYWNWKLFPINCFDRLGICADLYSFVDLRKEPLNYTNIGPRLRGIRDYSNYTSGPVALYWGQTQAAIVLNLDFPYHIATVEFSNHILKYFSFNLQVSPFMDIALTRNPVTDRILNLKDGYYTAGVEFLVYPLRFSNYEVRASVGIDLGRTLLSDYIDTSWRNDGSVYEYSLGIGLHF